MLILATLAVPLLAGLFALVVSWRAAVGWLSAGSAIAVLALGIGLCVETESHHAVNALGGTLRADSLSSFMVIVIGAVASLATLQTPRVMERQIGEGTTSRRHASSYVVLMQVFITCMLLAVLTANLGVLWVAIEATTIATTFLVSHHRTKKAFEASWKYVILCSVGIALAFLGTVLIYFAALHAGTRLSGTASLNWTSLMAIAPHLNHGVVRLALALLVLGYGTKVGFAPTHSWLADAHSQAPAPVSALMSGVLLTVAFYALLRFKAIADIALGPTFPRALFLVVGLLSLVLATGMLIAQRDLKRMLAYSSIEHMGLLALGAAAGSPLAIAAVLLHMLGHGLTKSTLFISSGEIAHTEGTTEMAKLRGLLARRPLLGGVFGVGLIALLGFPPFSLFISEFTMARAEVNVGLWWVVAASLVCLGAIFASITNHARRVLFGAGASSSVAARSLAIPLVSALVVCAVLGVSAWPLLGFLHAAAHVVAR
ncbi:MAG: proton-conducting transporter membrane subunit [Acidimicrobiales bacterium]